MAEFFPCPACGSALTPDGTCTNDACPSNDSETDEDLEAEA